MSLLDEAEKKRERCGVELQIREVNRDVNILKQQLSATEASSRHLQQPAKTKDTTSCRFFVTIDKQGSWIAAISSLKSCRSKIKLSM